MKLYFVYTVYVTSLKFFPSNENVMWISRSYILTKLLIIKIFWMICILVLYVPIG